jgi:hypothetical protein
MPQFSDHIKQAQSNLSVLKVINQASPTHFDWQVTVCFYTALHLVNAHLAKYNQQYRNHTDVKHVLNPFNAVSVMKLTPDAYTAYTSLFSLSRRARYLINEKDDNLNSNTPFFTHDKHLAKSIRHLDLLCTYFDKEYNLNLPKTPIKCGFITDKNTVKFFDPI